MAGDFPGPDARAISAMLNRHAEPLARMIFPAAVKAGGYLLIHSVNGERGDNMKIRISGPKQGTWADYGRSASDPIGTGDMLKLLQLTIGGGDFRKAIEEAKRYLNLDSMDPQALDRIRRDASQAQARAAKQKAGDDERKRRNSEAMWVGAAKLTPSLPPVKYLVGRGIDLAALGRMPGAIRYHHRLPHAELSDRLPQGETAYRPAMVTRYNDLAGQHAATHVTFLHLAAGRGWVKLPPVEVEDVDPDTGELVTKTVQASKKTYSPLFQGAHIPLWKGAHPGKLADLPAGVPVYVSEGIEDALSYAMADPAARIVAAGTLGNIGKLQLPPQAGDLIILAQNDTNPIPIAVLEKAIRAQQAQAAQQNSARRVLCKRPPAAIKDWNDWLRAEA